MPSNIEVKTNSSQKNIKMIMDNIFLVSPPPKKKLNLSIIAPFEPPNMATSKQFFPILQYLHQGTIMSKYSFQFILEGPEPGYTQFRGREIVCAKYFGNKSYVIPISPGFTSLLACILLVNSRSLLDMLLYFSTNTEHYYVILNLINLHKFWN